MVEYNMKTILFAMLTSLTLTMSGFALMESSLNMGGGASLNHPAEIAGSWATKAGFRVEISAGGNMKVISLNGYVASDTLHPDKDPGLWVGKFTTGMFCRVQLSGGQLQIWSYKTKEDLKNGKVLSTFLLDKR